MATLTTQNTWHGNPRGTVAYADTAYVNSVISPYSTSSSERAASTVPTYVSRQGPAPMVLDASIPLLGGAALPYQTSPLLAYLMFVIPTGVWAKGTTLTITATSLDGTETDTLVITIPQNTTQDTILDLLVSLIVNEIQPTPAGTPFAQFNASAGADGDGAPLLFISRVGFTGGPTCIFTALTITAP